MTLRFSRSLILASAIALLLAPTLPAWAKGLPKCGHSSFLASGQTVPNTADKNDGIDGDVDIPDDGTVQAGATLSYVDNGDGTITDLNTGLMWEKKNSLDGPPDSSNLHAANNNYTWFVNEGNAGDTIWDWLDDVNAEGGIGFAGYNDWRIPNVKELQSIVDYGRTGPAIDPIFGDTANGQHWSSTTSAGGSLYVDFGIGSVGYDILVPFPVRAVRAGCL